jgi:hypothetical protein
MDLDLKRAESKKTYSSPQLTTISLRPEEAVLGACKISGQSMPGSTCGVLGFCPNAGS